jgi:hypothetical protein
MVDKRMDRDRGAGGGARREARARGVGTDGSVPFRKDGHPEDIIIDPEKDLRNLVLDTTQRVVIKRKIY